MIPYKDAHSPIFAPVAMRPRHDVVQPARFNNWC